MYQNCDLYRYYMYRSFKQLKLCKGSKKYACNDANAVTLILHDTMEQTWSHMTHLQSFRKYGFRPTEIFNREALPPEVASKDLWGSGFLHPNSRLSGQIGKDSAAVEAVLGGLLQLRNADWRAFCKSCDFFARFFFTLEQLGPFLMLFEHRIAKHYVAQTTCTKD